MTAAIACAVIGSGNIGSDLVAKLIKSPVLEPRFVVGIDPSSAGLRRAAQSGLETSSAGIDWLLGHPDCPRLAFDATSANAHRAAAPKLKDAGITVVDLTPAAIGPPVVPTVNLERHLDQANVNLVTCGGQATVPVVAAIAEVASVGYAEIISAIASRSAGPGTRQNIDEFTETTARALVQIGGAGEGKAIIILNPADPPILMRNTIHVSVPIGVDQQAVTDAVKARVAEVADYVPGYRLRTDPIFMPAAGPANQPPRERCTVLLEVEGSGMYLPSYAGNLDIMTAAAVRVGERVARRIAVGSAA